MSCVELTDVAATEIKNIMTAQNLGAESHLRMTILGGGCSGMKYTLGFDSNVNPEEDLTFEEKGVKVVTQKKYAPHLTGTEVDFMDTPTAKGFAIENPNFPKGGGCPGCGC
ncbi:MAG: iron-sulfur cluster assembly accessory protein [Planctomycetaceae bacterium]|jgi:iron-sulfur cluster assembly protein|nr:iron-sulfur cluster assembly accessory protein [Planctomycetaceae bacterium]